MKRHGWTVRVGALGLAVWAASAGVADPPGCRLYTTTADFDTGRYQGTNATAVADQVQLNTGATTYENAWIADSGDGLVIKIDTNTGRAVAGYLTGAPLRSASGSNFDNDAGNCGFGGNLGPSRTSVDRDGNCWVGNRAFGKQPTLTQILAEGGEDRNGNGVIDTSRDIDGDGVIEISVPGEVLPWGQDERVARHYRVGVNNGVARAVAVGPNGNVYVGMFNERRIYEVASNVTAPPPAGAAPTPLNTWTLPGGTGNGPYGFAFGPNGRLYVGTISTVSYELDPGTGAFRTFSHPSATSYGIAVDANGIVFLAGLTSPARLIRLNPSTSSVTYHDVPGTTTGRGVTVDFDGNIWMSTHGSGSGGSVAKFTPAGTLLGNFSAGVGSICVGTGVAANGNILTVNQSSINVTEFLTDGTRVRIIPTSSGPSPCLYTYSDFTGSGRATTIERTGRWSATYDSGQAGAAWGRVTWSSNEPMGTLVTMEARAADTTNPDGTVPGTFLPVMNGTPFAGVNGRYIEVRATLSTTRITEQISPELHNVEVCLLNQAPIARCKDVTVCTDPDRCDANVTAAQVDDGSFDPDGDALTYTVSPSGPYPVGQTMVTLTVQDPAGLSDSCPATITVNDCQPPTIQCPDNITVGNDPGQCTAVVNYTVTASDNCPGVMVACDPPSGHAFPMGTTTVNCLATDAAGNTTPCSFTVTVEDREAPTLSVSVTTTQMWPANHDLINVGLSISATDNCDGNLASRAVIRVYSDEDDELETGDGNHSPDAKPGHEFGGDAGPLRLRAERQNSGDGRVYLILVTVRDNAGNSTTRCATVTVPKSNSAANRASVAAQAAAAAAACPNVPAGFVPVGDGAPVGPKQ